MHEYTHSPLRHTHTQSQNHSSRRIYAVPSRSQLVVFAIVRIWTICIERLQLAFALILTNKSSLSSWSLSSTRNKTRQTHDDAFRLENLRFNVQSARHTRLLFYFVDSQSPPIFSIFFSSFVRSFVFLFFWSGSDEKCRWRWHIRATEPVSAHLIVNNM